MAETDETSPSIYEYLARATAARDEPAKPARHSRHAAVPYGEPSARNASPDVRQRYLGKYRGTVAENEDPLSRGRLLLLVPDVLGVQVSSWALPCLPLTGIATGMFVRPSIGTGVWVEFEQGDPQRPIWTGCFWNAPPQSIPTAALQAPPAIPVVTIETATGGVSVCDAPIGDFGAVCIRSGAAQITLTEAEIQIQAPAVSILTGTLTVNGASLMVA
jgi:Type VI secretion system/phage-baseplate injector OB domain